MDFGTSIKTCLGKYATFQGRASRSEYWYFILFTILVNVVLSVVSGVLGDLGSIVTGLVMLGLVLPGLAIMGGVPSRHERDYGRTLGLWRIVAG